jgi:hypothetical protein
VCAVIRKALSLSTICNPLFVTEVEMLIKELREISITAVNPEQSWGHTPKSLYDPKSHYLP